MIGEAQNKMKRGSKKKLSSNHSNATRAFKSNNKKTNKFFHPRMILTKSDKGGFHSFTHSFSHYLEVHGMKRGERERIEKKIVFMNGKELPIAQFSSA